MEIISAREKAIKLLEIITASPEAKTFAKRFQGHFQTNFTRLCDFLKLLQAPYFSLPPIQKPLLPVYPSSVLRR